MQNNNNGVISEEKRNTIVSNRTSQTSTPAEEPFYISASIENIFRSPQTKNTCHTHPLNDNNLTCKISITTSHGNWFCNRTFEEFENCHKNITTNNDNLRGVHIPDIPLRNKKQIITDEQMPDYIHLKQLQYTKYLSEIVHRSILLSSILDFIQAPLKIRSKVKKICEEEVIKTFFHRQMY